MLRVKKDLGPCSPRTAKEGFPRFTPKIYRQVIEGTTVKPTILTAIERRLAEERLDAYRQDGAAPNVALGRYLWNVAVSESLYPDLQFAEVALRNRLHECLTLRYFGPGWYDDSNCPLQPWQNVKVASAKQKLTKSGSSDYWGGFRNA